MARIAVIDYGMGNLRSVAKALEHVDDRALVQVTSDPATIRAAERVVLPGVGAIRECMAELQRLELDVVIREVAQDRPFLAVCMGMQALLADSEENDGVRALGVFSGTVRHFDSGFREAGIAPPGKVPHMGWNRVRQCLDHPLWAGIDDASWFYFVHSYYVPLRDDERTAGVTGYGIDFSAALAEGNVFATQFHPEKSQHAGLALLANFTRWDGTR